MAPLSSSSGDSGGWALNGSLAQPYHSKAKQLLRTLICSKQKVKSFNISIFNKVIAYLSLDQESLMEVSRGLLECLSREGLSVKLSGKLARPSALQLKTFIQQFK